MLDIILPLQAPSVMPFEQLRILLALLGTAAATYYDVANNRNVPDILLYSFLAASIILNAVSPWGGLLYTFAVAALVFLSGWLFYRLGQLGGADVFVLASIALLLPAPPQSLLQQPAASPFQIPFILSVFSIAGFLFIITMLLLHLQPAISAYRKGKVKIPIMRWLYTAASAMLIITVFQLSAQYPFLPPFFTALVAIIMLASSFFMLFREFVRDQMIEMVKWRSIEPEDVLALEKLSPALVKKYKLPRVVGEPDLQRLRKAPIASWPVYKKMHVFLPYILIGLLASLLLGDIFAFFAY